MATAQTIGPEQHQRYLWWFPGSPVRVHLDLRVVQELKNRLLYSDAGPASPEEGLLFGEIGSGATVILEFQSAATESVRSLIEKLSPDKKRSLVGYYRTESRDAFKLNPQDHSLAQDHFARPYNVFLLVHRNSFGPPTAMFFFHDGNGRMVDFAFMEFPFDPSLLASEQDDRMRRTQQVQPIAVAAAQPPAVPPIAAQPPPTRPRSPRKSLVWTCALTSAVALGVSLSSGSSRARYSNVWHALANTLSQAPATYFAARSSSRPLISLRAIKQSGFLALTWDRDSALIKAAISGVLSIRDGDSTRVIACDSAQLRDGSLLYVPETDQISMQLTVNTPTRTYVESVTVILPRAAEFRAVAPLPKALGGLEGSLRTLPTSANAATTFRDLQDHPAVLAAIPVVEGPTAPFPVSATYKPAVAILKVQPKFPPELQPLLVRKTAIEVSITIDMTGRVIQAGAIPQETIDHLLLKSVVNTSMAWKFKPALRNNQPVTSEAVLKFVFAP
jgi:hypothetical protein